MGKKLLHQKVAQNIAIFISSESHSWHPKVAQLAKKSPNLVTLTGLNES
jgi:hypothetical protein